MRFAWARMPSMYSKHSSCLLFCALLSARQVAAQTAPPAEAPAAEAIPSQPQGPIQAEAAVTAKEPKKAKTKEGGKGAESAKEATSVEETALALSVGKASLGFGARVIAGFEYQTDELTAVEESAMQRATEFGWFLSQARFTVDGSWDKSVSLQLDLDFSDNDDPIRDAWLNLRFERELQLRVGSFKRAFSRLELRGAGKIPFRSRGLANAHIVNDLGYGERSLGAELWGKLRAQGLHWTLGASDAPNVDAGIDLHARLAYSPLSWLEVGGSAVHKIVENNLSAQPDFIAGNAYGVDLRVEHGPLYVLVDALKGENLGTLGLFEPDANAIRNDALSVGGYATYRVPLLGAWQLEPMLFGEWIDTNLEFSRSEVTRFVGGINALFHEELFRLMPQVELIRPLHSDSLAQWSKRETFYILFSGQI
jgi:hypothetical protein